ncbi:MAG: hypothetical protein WBE91_08790 [Steroidobacteraceae bacterium]
MSGVLATVKLMFTALSLQRLLLRAGAVLALLGAAGMIAGALGSPRWWTPVSILGSCLFLAPSPMLVGPVLLRSLGASRTIRLMPHGRSQLLLGGFCAQILVALIAALAGATIVGYSGNPLLHDRVSAEAAAAAGLFVCAFALATLSLVILYYSSAHQLGFIFVIVYGVLFEALSVVFPHWSVHELLTSASGLLIVFIGALSLWALFAAAYLGAGRITPPVLNGEDNPLMRWFAARDGHALIAHSERNAARVLLTGKHFFGLRVTRLLIGAGGSALFFYYLSLRGLPPPNTAWERFLAVFTAYVGGLLAALSIHPMIGRARYLWLKTRLDRRQLFRAVEAESWRTLLSVDAFFFALYAYVCLLSRVPWSIVTQVLLLSLVSGAAMIYVLLQSTRKWPVVDALLLIGLSALWFFGLLRSGFGGGGLWLLLLVAAELLLVPLLRIWALSRWARIDWMINRPPRLPG